MEHLEYCACVREYLGAFVNSITAVKPNNTCINYGKRYIRLPPSSNCHSLQFYLSSYLGREFSVPEHKCTYPWISSKSRRYHFRQSQDLIYGDLLFSDPPWRYQWRSNVEQQKPCRGIKRHVWYCSETSVPQFSRAPIQQL